jgi:hypothetical protein
MRLTRDPYKIWVSEIIMQQTRINQGIPYYLRFIEAFPDRGRSGCCFRRFGAEIVAGTGLLQPGAQSAVDRHATSWSSLEVKFRVTTRDFCS